MAIKRVLIARCNIPGEYTLVLVLLQLVVVVGICIQLRAVKRLRWKTFWLLGW